MFVISFSLQPLFQNFSHAAATVLIISIVAGVGMAIGSLKFRGISMGVAGVLFAGIGFGHFGVNVDELTLEFLREFGLILFVYSIGMQVGPGFLSSLRNQGFKLNLIAFTIVMGNVAIAALYGFFGLVPAAVVVGLLSGAVTNTPGLAAALQAIKEIPNLSTEQLTGPATGYALSYPFGVIGIILAMILVRVIMRINVQEESKQLENSQKTERASNANITVNNPSLQGKTIDTIYNLVGSPVIISRQWRNGTMKVPSSHDILLAGDVIHVVADSSVIDRLCLAVGERSEVNLLTQKSPNVSSKKVLITRREAIGKTLGEIDTQGRLSVTVTRVTRAGIEFIATPDVHLQFGDSLRLVGEAEGLDKAQKFFGNSLKKLDHPNLLPILLGITCGVLLGSIPFSIPGLPAPVKLGLAGGPLIAAIIFARLGNIGKVTFYLPNSANLMLRELGIALFLAAVGLKAGEHFIEYVLSGDGPYWMLLAAIITLVPLLGVALYARIKGNLNYFHLCGLMAGSMTDPPALAFANSIAHNEAPSVTYATVYPMVMILRILTAQILVSMLLS
jgi:putative transport protein